MGGVAGKQEGPWRIGQATKLRIGVTAISVIGTSVSDQPSAASRRCSAAQIRSSDNEVDRPLLDQARPLAGLDVLAIPRLDGHLLDPGKV